MLTIIGHRFGHQSGLNTSPRRISTTYLHGIVFHVTFGFSAKVKHLRLTHIYGNGPSENTCCNKNTQCLRQAAISVALGYRSKSTKRELMNVFDMNSNSLIYPVGIKNEIILPLLLSFLGDCLFVGQ